MSSRPRPTVAVAGGAGYLGSVLCRHLLDAGYPVRVLDRCFFGEGPLGACRDASDHFEVVRVDSRDVTAEHFRGCELAVDLAGLSNDPSCAIDPHLTDSINVDGGVRLLEAARDGGVRRYLYQSSCSVYGTTEGEAVTEDSPLGPVSAYAESKVAMERRVLDAGGDRFEAVVSRMGTLFGLSPRMRFDLIVNLMTLCAERDGRIIVLGGGRQWRPLIHVRDAARALRLLLEAPAGKAAGRVWNAGDSESNYRASRVARIVSRVVGDTEIFVAPDDPDPRSYRVDCRRFQELTGFRRELTPEDGAREVLGALDEETVASGIETRTVEFYRYLLDAKRRLDEVILEGRLL